MRVFAGIDIEDSKLKQELANVTESFCGSGRAVSPENYHITLKFFGDSVTQNAVDTIKQKMDNLTADSREFTVKGLGAFPSEEYITVVWAGTDRRIMPIVNTFNTQFDLREDFTPHITLCRFNTLPPEQKNTVQQHLKTHEDTVFGTAQATEITLKKSILTADGPIYETLHCVPLS